MHGHAAAHLNECWQSTAFDSGLAAVESVWQHQPPAGRFRAVTASAPQAPCALPTLLRWSFSGSTSTTSERLFSTKAEAGPAPSPPSAFTSSAPWPLPAAGGSLPGCLPACLPAAALPAGCLPAVAAVEAGRPDVVAPSPTCFSSPVPSAGDDTPMSAGEQGAASDGHMLDVISGVKEALLTTQALSLAVLLQQAHVPYAGIQPLAFKVCIGCCTSTWRLRSTSLAFTVTALNGDGGVATRTLRWAKPVCGLRGEGACRGCMQRAHAEGACRGCMQRVHAGGAWCDIHRHARALAALIA